MSGRYDLFISYAHTDAEWVQVLADNLHRLGLTVFLDRWEIRAGDVVVRELERGIKETDTGVIVVSPASMASAWVMEEYAAMLVRVVDGKQQRIIPVLLADVDDMPPFLPWETVRLPAAVEGGPVGSPLVLHPNLRLYRAGDADDAAPAIQVSGPLRILVAIGSPEEQNDRNDLLDMELEQRLILDAVEPARRAGGAVVRVLPWGTVAAIREALQAALSQARQDLELSRCLELIPSRT